jgi:hypothetical protein
MAGDAIEESGSGAGSFAQLVDFQTFDFPTFDGLFLIPDQK